MTKQEQKTSKKYNVVKLVKPRSAYLPTKKTTLHRGHSKKWCLKKIDEYYSKNKDYLIGYVIAGCEEDEN